MNRRTMMLGLAACAAPSCAAAATRTYRYASTPGADANLQSLDVYGAAAGARRPLLIFIHGGAWAEDDKSYPVYGSTKAAAFVKRGMVYASLNYRLSPAVRHPAHIQDVAAAIAWLHDHGREIGADPDRLYVMGHSAGAHLAALVATDETRLGAHNLPLSILKGVIAIDGAGYDLTQEAPLVERRVPELRHYYAEAFGADGALWADASPVSHVAPGKHIPPFLIPYTMRLNAGLQANELAAALRRAGIEAETLLSPNQDHPQIDADIGSPGDKVSAAIYAALRRWGA